MLVRDIWPGNNGSTPLFLTQANGVVFFQADNGVSGPELWRSNGTPAGTELVRDIHPGSSGSMPRYLTNVNGNLFFAADNGMSGTELWQSNGTGAGTALVLNIAPGAASSNPAGLTNINGILYFAADDIVRGVEAWILSVPASSAESAVAAGLSRSLTSDLQSRMATAKHRQSGAADGRPNEVVQADRNRNTPSGTHRHFLHKQRLPGIGGAGDQTSIL
jgi:ELWxxDGT repeat protein